MKEDHTVEISDTNTLLNFLCYLKATGRVQTTPVLADIAVKDGAFRVKWRHPSDFKKTFKYEFYEFLNLYRKKKPESCDNDKDYNSGEKICLTHAKSWEKRIAVPAPDRRSCNLHVASPASVPHSEKILMKSCTPLSMIESEILPLVLALNSIQECITLYSCKGHFINKPYVTFFANDSTVRQLASVLGSATGYLNKRWKITGRAYNACPPFIPAVNWTITPEGLYFRKKKILEDVRVLSEMLISKKFRNAEFDV